MKNLILAGALLGLLLLLAGCQGEPSDTEHVASLPLPQVRVDKLPTATPTATSTPEPEIAETPTPTPIPQAQMQPMPTRDDEAFWLAQIEILLDRIERRLNALDRDLGR
ncbi:MAG: hypothetical protein R6W69_12255 [Anaerolineales bacterium]